MAVLCSSDVCEDVDVSLFLSSRPTRGGFASGPQKEKNLLLLRLLLERSRIEFQLVAVYNDSLVHVYNYFGLIVSAVF